MLSLSQLCETNLRASGSPSLRLAIATDSLSFLSTSLHRSLCRVVRPQEGNCLLASRWLRSEVLVPHHARSRVRRGRCQQGGRTDQSLACLTEPPNRCLPSLAKPEKSLLPLPKTHQGTVFLDPEVAGSTRCGGIPLPSVAVRSVGSLFLAVNGRRIDMTEHPSLGCDSDSEKSSGRFWRLACIP